MICPLDEQPCTGDQSERCALTCRTRARMRSEGIPVGTDNATLLALGGTPLIASHHPAAPLLDLVMTRQLAAAVRSLHSPRTFDLGQYGIPACSTVCAECRQSWPCATEQAMLNSGSLS